MIVTSEELQAEIRLSGQGLGLGNPANFLKDIVRRVGASGLWPPELTAQRVTARQRFGGKRVLEFIPFDVDQTEPFPDRFEPDARTAVYDIQSISLPHAARRLGREEETWLAQIVVNLGIIESQIAFQSTMAGRVKDLVHLQIGMKTQPEIDATFILTASSIAGDKEEHILITCEAKGDGERLLEDQIRFQIHQGFKSTKHLSDPFISGVKPIAVKLVTDPAGDGRERLIYVVEFRTIDRATYEASWEPRTAAKGKRVDDTPVYLIPLECESKALFRVRPPVSGISYRKSKAKPKA
ncbi:MAG: hypothetical protein JWR84_1982 [Caulobacter sp.]|nr:hypothetical protein [Caulobacter sp.]